MSPGGAFTNSQRQAIYQRESLMDDVVGTRTGCWLWKGYVGPEGYGIVTRDGETSRVHRLYYEAFVGPIQPGLTVDHLCHNRDESCTGGPGCAHRRCCNPDHLEAVSSGVNTLRGKTITAANAAKTHCDSGHEFTPENTRMTAKGRSCKACDRVRTRAHTVAQRKPCRGCGGPKGDGKWQSYCPTCREARS